MPRVKAKKEVEAPDILKYDRGDFRFATPKIVSWYRAERLKCDTLCEIGAGVGFQTIAFARKCKKVYAVEIDKRKCSCLKENMKLLGLKNVEVICADGLKVSDKVKDADVVFVDTERAPAEDVRKLSSIKPDVRKLVELYGEKLCVELPPQIRELDLDCEKEYVSVGGELNRLNLYFGKLRKHETNVVLLPSGERLEGKGREVSETKKFDHKFIYDINPAVVRAGLEGELPGEVFRFGKKEHVVSNKKLDSKFLKGFKVLGGKDVLKKFGKVVLKYEPKDYWEERKKLEAGLKGKKTCYLFKFDEFFACEKLNK